MPVRLESGSLGTLTVDLGSAGQPSTSSSASHHSTSAPAGSGSSSGGGGSSAYSLNLALSHLYLCLVLEPPQSLQASGLSDDGPATADLASSVLSVADEFVHGELDAQEEHDLLASVRTLRRDQDSDPFLAVDSEGRRRQSEEDNDDLWLPPGAMRPFVEKPRPDQTDAEGVKSLVMGLVEGMLARLKVQVQDVRVRIRFPPTSDKPGDDCDEEIIIELRMSAVSYHNEITSSSESAKPGKVLRLSSFKVTLLQQSQPISSVSTPTRRSSTSTLFQPSPIRQSTTSHSSSSSSSDGDPNSTLMMSQAIADLREGSLTDSSQSIYQSATEGGTASFLVPNPADTPWANAEPVSIRRPLPEPESWQTLLSLGDEDVILRFGAASPTATRSFPSRPQAPSLQRSGSSSSGDTGSKPTSRISQTALQGPSISLQVPDVIVLILPKQVAAVSNIVGQLLASRPSPPAPSLTAPKGVTSTATPSAHLLLNLRSVMLVAVYTEDALPSAALDAFWSKPRGGILSAGHLVCKLGPVEALSSPPASAIPSRDPLPVHSANQALYIEDLSLFEHLAPSVVALSAGSGDPAPAVAPILIVDPNLPSQYEGTFPTFDSHDWRSGDRARKAGAVEKAWQVRSGRAKFAPSAKESSPAHRGPALHALQSEASTESKLILPSS